MTQLPAFFLPISPSEFFLLSQQKGADGVNTYTLRSNAVVTSQIILRFLSLDHGIESLSTFMIILAFVPHHIADNPFLGFSVLQK